MFNDQQLINMSQDKARKYISDIEIWINELDKIDLNYNAIINENNSNESSLSSTNLITTKLTSLSMDCDIELINNHFNDTSLDTSSQKSSSSSKKSNDLDDRHHQQTRLVKNSSKLKQNVLVKDFELTTTQLKSLYFMFEKRQDQLKKIAYPQISKPIQRVEPQQNDILIANSLFNSAASPILFTNPQFMQQSANIIKRDSMNKVKLIYNYKKKMLYFLKIN